VKYQLLIGAPEEIRTPDPQIRSLALFQPNRGVLCDTPICQLSRSAADPIETRQSFAALLDRIGNKWRARR
jgi:hypothetical protein